MNTREPNMDFANTYNMDTRKLEKPVVMSRTERGREIKTVQFPADDETADVRSKVSTFHEGYVDGKLYLVPDSNLEAMADIVNLKMRRHEKSKYLNLDPQKEAEALQRYEQKREDLLNKLDMLDFEAEEEEQEEEEEKEEEEEEQEVEEQEVEEEEELLEMEEEESEEGETEEEESEEVIQEEEHEVEEEESEEEEAVKEEAEEEEEVEEHEVEEEELLEVEEAESEEEEAVKEEEDELEDAVDVEEELEEEMDTIFPGKYYNPKVKRFLISGHFRTNRKPIYIIQQYTGPSVFSTKDPQFYSHKSEKDIDIFISGEFYKETILEENKKKEPKRLKTKPRMIRIDKSSRIYEDKFSDTFVGEDVDVTLTGSFIKHSLSTVYTPMLAISVKKGTLNADNEKGRQSAASVYVSRPVVENIFEKEKNRRPRAHSKVPKQGVERPHKKSLSKFSANGRNKAGYSFPCKSKAVTTMFLSTPQGAGPFDRRSKRDEKLALIKARVRDPNADVSRDDVVPGSSEEHVKPPGKRKTKKCRRDGGKAERSGQGAKKKGSKRKSTTLSVEDTDERGQRFGPPINLERKIDVLRERRKKEKKKEDTKTNVGAKLLDRLFKL